MSMAHSGQKKILIMGIGNTLLQDDGAGVHVTQGLRATAGKMPEVSIVDGGTLGLSLLPELENASDLIVVDAGEIGGRAGDIKVFENEAMDQQLSGKKSTVHELSMSDLLAAATLTGHQPERRALVAIQPASIEWGLEPTSDVRKAIPLAAELVNELARNWAS
jgi:hydrogenase maturation protease